MSNKIRIVLSGSGTLYPAHAGALQALEDLGFEFEEICGVSGGSIIAGAIAYGYKAEDIKRFIIDTLPSKSKIIDYSWWPFKNYGLIKGEKIRKNIKKIIPCTFSGLKIPLKVIALNISFREKKVFGSEETPYMDVSEAIMASMSIPGLFKARKIDNSLYVDGSVVDCFPVDIFNEYDNVYGLKICNSGCYIYREKEDIKSVKSFMSSIVDSIISENSREQVEDAKNASVIYLNVPRKTVDFGITEEQCLKIMEQGYNSVINYFS